MTRMMTTTKMMMMSSSTFDSSIIVIFWIIGGSFVSSTISARVHCARLEARRWRESCEASFSNPASQEYRIVVPFTLYS
jgi:hypothetical protein